MNESIDILIAKHLTGEADAVETKQLLDWIAASDANRKYYEQTKTVFDNAHLSEALTVDTDAAWNKMKVRLQYEKPEAKIIGMPARQFLRMAAALVLISAVAFLIYRNYLQSTPELTGNVMASKEVINYTLPDSSEVVLNKNSSVSYAFNAKEKRRFVHLKGEAYFNVKHDTTQQFIVNANGIYLRDIGTAFNVKAIEGSDEINVMVSEGIVELTDSVNTIILNAGESAVYSKNRKQFTTSLLPDSNAIAYKTGIFNFNNTSLELVAATLNEVYETEIVISDAKTKSCKLTATFRNEKIENIADIISATFNLKLKTETNKIILSGGNCE